jgi:hypothetical protein
MLERNRKAPDGCRPGGRRGVTRAGSSLLALLAGMSLLGAAVSAVVLAGLHSTAVAASADQCSQLCVSVQAATGTVRPGEAEPFIIQISPGTPLDEVTAQISVTTGDGSPAFPAPTFTSCGDGEGTQVCTVGLLQSGETTDLSAEVLVPAAAPGGDTATVSATVSWSLLGLIGAGSATGSGTVEVVKPTPPPPSSPPPSSPPPSSPPPSSSPPTSSHPTPPSSGTPGGGGGTGSSGGGGGGGGASSSPGGQSRGNPASAASRLAGLGPGIVVPLNGLPLLSAGSSVAGTDPGGLFPTIYPAPPGSPSPRARAGRGVYRATAAADVLPLSIRQVDTEVGALIVLVLGVAIAVVRVPLRRQAAGLALRAQWTRARSRVAAGRNKQWP